MGEPSHGGMGGIGWGRGESQCNRRNKANILSSPSTFVSLLRIERFERVVRHESFIIYITKRWKRRILDLGEILFDLRCFFIASIPCEAMETKQTRLSLKKRTGRYERNLLYHRGKKDSDY